MNSLTANGLRRSELNFNNNKVSTLSFKRYFRVWLPPLLFNSDHPSQPRHCSHASMFSSALTKLVLIWPPWDNRRQCLLPSALTYFAVIFLRKQHSKPHQSWLPTTLRNLVLTYLDLTSKFRVHTHLALACSLGLWLIFWNRLEPTVLEQVLPWIFSLHART